MPTSVVNTKAERELAPGKSGTWVWNNAAPHDAVWSANAVPVPSGDTQKGFNEVVSLEVTRLWRRLIVTELDPHSQATQLKVEHEIHYEVENVGDAPARFVVFLSAVS